jgi:hypothetical protein
MVRTAREMIQATTTTTTTTTNKSHTQFLVCPDNFIPVPAPNKRERIVNALKSLLKIDTAMSENERIRYKLVMDVKLNPVDGSSQFILKPSE